MSYQKDIEELINFLKSKQCTEDEINAVVSPIYKNFSKRICGIVWDNQEEDIFTELKNTFPIMQRNKKYDKYFSDENINHILIEGDNLKSLMALQYSFIDDLDSGKIDIIYIDPPYNMGKKDFKYNDCFVEKTDQYIHSKWLSFMYKRLKLAKNLLSEKGIIFISIDDNEYANLKLMCDMDELFEENNYINTIFVLDNLKGKSTDKLITNIGHKVLVYAKNKSVLLQCGGFVKPENIFGDTVEKKFTEHEDGYYNEISLLKTGSSKFRKDRGTMYFPILEKEGQLYCIEDHEYNKIYDSKSKLFDDDFVNVLRNKYTQKGFNFLLPIDGEGNLLRWTHGFDGIKKLIEENNLIYNPNTNKLSEKQRPSAKEMLQHYADGVAKSLFYKPSYANGTNDLNNALCCKSDFSFPKPVSLIEDLLALHPNKDATVLDFFAGSGTTAQSVFNLNKKDGGKRRVILCTNNEVDYKTEVKYLNSIGKLSEKPYLIKDAIPKAVEESYKNYISNQKDDYKQVVNSENYNKLGICQSITHHRISNLIDFENSPLKENKIFHGNNLIYYKLIENCEESPIEEVLVSRVIDKFISYIELKENCFRFINHSNDFTVLLSKEKTIVVSKKSFSFIDELYDNIANIFSEYENKIKIVYATIDKPVTYNDIKFNPYPNEILEKIRKSKREVE